MATTYQKENKIRETCKNRTCTLGPKVPFPLKKIDKISVSFGRFHGEMQLFRTIACRRLVLEHGGIQRQWFSQEAEY